ncbi:hypothetical protein [Parabacteroides bouchesdurhonensis]|uniref:hypothetical protein n=1 Tax=Parabacteroides bouchesdurhonensis TaxID=1936995 RepID=UPI000E4AAD03|nr:hypothetical protein [Parabacteroides bouchesdurhonensis]RHJ93005.1 hypothetical protein DW095_06520 [Bacteroides sp. AM07-16]
MKILYFFILSLIWSQCALSQNSLYKLKTRKIGEWSPDPKPNPNTPKTKIINQITKDNSKYTIYIKEYVEGKPLYDPYAILGIYNANKNYNVHWEIDPDTTSKHQLRIFSIFPDGSMAIRERTCNADEYFNYVYFKYSKDVVYEKEIPLVFIYEDDLKERMNEQFVNKYLGKNTVIDVEKRAFPFSKFRRYILIYYIASIYK